MAPRVRALLLFGSIYALPLAAGYSGRDLFIPIIGQSVRFDGRVFSTSLWLTNVSSSDVEAKLTFMTMANGKPLGHVSHVHLRRGETRLFDEVGPDILGAPQGTGALHVESTGDVLSSARLFSRMPNEPASRSVGMSLAGIPAQFAIGSDRSTTLPGVAPGDYRYKLYLVETTGQPLAFAISILDLDGHELGRRIDYVAGNEQRSIDLHDLFPDVRVSRGVLRLSGVNGTGRIIAGGAQIAVVSEDGTLFEMSMNTKPRYQLTPAEILVYGIVALVLASALLASRWR